MNPHQPSALETAWREVFAYEIQTAQWLAGTSEVHPSKYDGEVERLRKVIGVTEALSSPKPSIQVNVRPI